MECHGVSPPFVDVALCSLGCIVAYCMAEVSSLVCQAYQANFSST